MYFFRKFLRHKTFENDVVNMQHLALMGFNSPIKTKIQQEKCFVIYSLEQDF